jgi:hypothetical protein
MKTLDEIWALAESLNEDAHSEAWDSWIAADEMEDSDEDEDGTTAEQLREEASDEQAGYFRDSYWDLGEEDQVAIKHWLKEDESFRDQFSTWFGYDAFEEEFDIEDK